MIFEKDRGDMYTLKNYLLEPDIITMDEKENI